MKPPPDAARAAPATLGLRERKKLRTRAAIQREALRLFREQGYRETSVEEIAAAAEFSTSTFFRYFPTKEDVVMFDFVDPLIYDAFRAQPPELGVVAALRNAMHTALGQLTADELADQLERGRLVVSVPDLRAAMFGEMLRTGDTLAALVAERMERPAEDPRIRVFTGALIGGLMAALLPAAADLAGDLSSLLETAFDELDATLTF